MNGQKLDEEMLTRALQSLATEMEQLAAPPELEAKLRESFRARHRTVAAVRGQSIYWWAAAVAAMLLIALSVIAIRWRSEGVKDPRHAQIHSVPQDQELVKSVSADDHGGPPLQNARNGTENRKVRHARPVVSRRLQNNDLANHLTREIATDFIPLGYMNVASLQEGGQIVRVELPRSALVNFGLPVNMDRYNEKVKADVLLGVDGLAHAIRFVQ
jgi:hypothetical protein